MTEPTETARYLLDRYGLPEDVIDGALALHAQELDAKVRSADLPDWAEALDTFDNGASWAADLINPAVPDALAGTANAEAYRTAPALSAGVAPATGQAAPCRTTQHCAYHGWCHRCAPAFAAVMSRVNVAIQRTEPDESQRGYLYEAVGKALQEVPAALLPAPAEEHRLALSEALGLGTGAPWDAIHDRARTLRTADESAREGWEQAAIQRSRATAWREEAERLRIDRAAESAPADTGHGGGEARPEWARLETEEEKLARARRMAKALSAPPATPPEWATTTEWPSRHKRAGDRRVHATAPFIVNGVQRIWTACEKNVGEGGYSLNHMPVDCRDCKRAIEPAAAQQLKEA